MTNNISLGNMAAFAFCMVAITLLWFGAGMARFFAWMFGIKSGLEEEGNYNL